MSSESGSGNGEPPMFNYTFRLHFSTSGMWPMDYSNDSQLDYDDDGGEESAVETYSIKSIFRTIAFVCSVIMILCCIIGIFGNVISILIFTRASMRRLSVNFFLTALSVVDLTLVVLAVPVFAINGLNDYFLNRKLYENIYAVVVFALYPVSMISQSCSIWTFVLISIERYYAVCHPLKVKRLLTVGRARVAEFLLFLLAIAYNLVRFFEYGRSPDPETGYLERHLRRNKLYFTFYYTTLYLLTHFLIPFTIITTLNVLILRRLRRARRERQRLSHAQQEQCRTTRMIIVVTIMFGVCNTLPFVVNLWEAFDFRLFDEETKEVWTSPNEWPFEYVDSSETAQDYYSGQQDEVEVEEEKSSTLNASIAYLLLDISNTLVVANAASPFIVCLIYCRQYRKLFRKYCTLLCKRCARREIDQMPTASSSNWESYALRPYITSVENISAAAAAAAAAATANDFRPRSNCLRYNRLHRSMRNFEKTKESELEQLKPGTYVNGLVILDKESVTRSILEMKKRSQN